MGTKDEEFLEQLRATFKVEAGEHVQAIQAGLLELEKTPAPEARRSIVETVFRAAHSLKGAARAADFSSIEAHCQSLEGVFASWKRQENSPSPEVFDTLHRALEDINSALKVPVGPRVSARRTAVPATEAASLASPIPEVAIPQETVRIAVAKLDSRLLESEEMLTAKLAAGQRVADFRELSGKLEEWRKAWTAAEPDMRGLRQPRDQAGVQEEHGASEGQTRLLDFFDWSLDHIKSVESRMVAIGRVAEQDRFAIGKLVDELLEDSKKLLLLPFATITASFPKLVRDLCRDQGKEADLTIQGEDIEIDKRILEEMKDPLVHLLRNCVDHGIETPIERNRRGKASRASIKIEVGQADGNNVQLLVSDDGVGIDTRKVKESAIHHNLISAEEATRLSDGEAQALIFQSEVTTSSIITQVSGRGLGLAIVREKAEKLGGEVSMESRPGLGCTFRIVMPATRATFRGVLVEVAGRLLVVPTSQVERVLRVNSGDLQTIEGRATISFDGRPVALVHLADALGLTLEERGHSPSADAPVLVLGTSDQRIAFAVDSVLDEQEVLVKPLRKPLSRVRNIAAATVLGSGQVVPILNVADLLKSARKAGGADARNAAGVQPAKAMSRSILVVEDSITSRMLLKGILESAGHNVKTAVDGIEAFTLLRAEKFDLVVSDVEMPRMDGFDLTARIRADKKMSELPVVLVTALETREDRERGIDVGANAYLIKSSFDQSNLLEAVRRLI